MYRCRVASSLFVVDLVASLLVGFVGAKCKSTSETAPAFVAARNDGVEVEGGISCSKSLRYAEVLK